MNLEYLEQIITNNLAMKNYNNVPSQVKITLLHNELIDYLRQYLEYYYYETYELFLQDNYLTFPELIGLLKSVMNDQEFILLTNNLSHLFLLVINNLQGFDLAIYLNKNCSKPQVKFKNNCWISYTISKDYPALKFIQFMFETMQKQFQNFDCPKKVLKPKK